VVPCRPPLRMQREHERDGTDGADVAGGEGHGHFESGPSSGRAVEGAGAQTKTKSRGANWTAAEEKSLISAYVHVSFDSVRGANRKLEEFYGEKKMHFLRSDDCPTLSEFEKLPQSSAERTQWHGRGAKACRKRMTLLKTELTKLYSMRRRLDAMDLTGGAVTDEGLYRAAVHL
jgi:hypothetical protein